MARIFGVHAVLEIHSATEALQQNIKDLLTAFPTSLHLKSQQALIAYHLREFDDSEALFDDIYDLDPFRLDDIDTYSNILYVMEKRAKLSQMAQKYTQLDRFRPETCCLVGNYYSLRGDHEKAILYFRRALKLDRGYLSAWTLMGHEYVELKNTHAAVEAYRRAVGKPAQHLDCPHRLLCGRRQSQRLPCLVRLRANLRAAGDALLCSQLLPEGYCSKVRYLLPQAINSN